MHEKCDDLEGQLEVMANERDAARAKEEECFEIIAAKEEDLEDTNNGYVYLTEMLQAKEEELEATVKDAQSLRDTFETFLVNSKKLEEENVALRSEQQRLRGKIAEEEQMHKATQERYTRIFKDSMAESGRSSPENGQF